MGCHSGRWNPGGRGGSGGAFISNTIILSIRGLLRRSSMEQISDEINEVWCGAVSVRARVREGEVR